MREACRQMRVWQDIYPIDDPLTISVNISPRQLEQPDFGDQVAHILAETGLPPTSLRLEITESTLVNSSCTVMESLDVLRGLGVQLYIDDFGTGYSSLGYLDSLPIDAIKIDRTFVTNLGRVKSSAGVDPGHHPTGPRTEHRGRRRRGRNLRTAPRAQTTALRIYAGLLHLRTAGLDRRRALHHRAGGIPRGCTIIFSMQFFRSTLDDCDQVTGLAVAIDVLRAFTTAGYLFAAGVKQIILVSGVEEAFSFAKLPDSLILGEIDGIQVEGFDLGNSPSMLPMPALERENHHPAYHRGHAGCGPCPPADPICVAALTNALPPPVYIRRLNPSRSPSSSPAALSP